MSSIGIPRLIIVVPSVARMRQRVEGCAYQPRRLFRQGESWQLTAERGFHA
jgi:hypothetical protein